MSAERLSRRSCPSLRLSEAPHVVMLTQPALPTISKPEALFWLRIRTNAVEAQMCVASTRRRRREISIASRAFRDDFEGDVARRIGLGITGSRQRWLVESNVQVSWTHMPASKPTAMPGCSEPSPG